MSTALRAELETLAAENATVFAPVIAQLERTQKEERSDWDASYKLKTQPYPWSCTVEEGTIMQYVIRANGLKRGYEIATAFGFSALFLARGLQANGGKLTSLDCYVEESAGSFRYTAKEMRTHLALVKDGVGAGNPPECLAQARQSAEAAGVKGATDFAVGVSPDDVGTLLSGERLDFALVDGGHFENQPTLDFKALQPFLAPKCAVFFHDNNDNPAVEAAIKYASKALRCEPIVLQTFYSLTLIGRGLDPECVRKLKVFSKPFTPRPLPPLHVQLIAKVKRNLRKLTGRA